MAGEMIEETIIDRIAKLASEGRIVKQCRSNKLLTRLRGNSQHIAIAHSELSRMVARHESVPLGAEWILDNYYIIDEVIQQIRDHLPRSYYHHLPVLTSGIYEHFPRIYPLALAIVDTGEQSISEAEIRRAAEEYQQITSLEIGELWAFPIMLRLAVIELLRTLVEQTMQTITDRKNAAADISANRHLPAKPSDAYAIAAWESLRELNPTSETVEEWVSQHLVDPLAVRHREYCRQANIQVSIGNAVTTLRLLSVIDWKSFFEATSLVESLLRKDPAGTYRQQDFATRNRCRDAIEVLARHSHRPELDVAQAVLTEAAQSSPPTTIARFLFGVGRPKFARKLGATRPLWRRLQNWFLHRPGLLYFGLLFGLTLLVAAWPLAILAESSVGIVLVGFPLVLLVASELGLGLTNWIVQKIISPKVLPKMDFRNGIPKECSTFVVIPTLIAKPEQAPSLVERLEQHYLSNPDASLSHALLIDFTDAPQESMPLDEACLEALRLQIARLNKTYGDVAAPRFFAFHRRRLFNPSENCWMGWERKRGKLDEFNRVLRGATDTSYVLSEVEICKLPKVKFVLTLDVDTVLPRDAAQNMIATLAHPLNHPELSGDGRRVESGYAILQPRVSFLYRTGFRSWFARIFAGSAGVDPHSSASSDTFMDLFGRGSFTGKGLYEVDAFAASVGRAFPDNAILSHDLIESNYARCALATDIEVFDEFPSRYHAYARRDHRWIRGDWQLLPWLGRTVPAPSGQRIANILPLLECWKIVDNLRRSLVPPAIVLLLIMAWTVLPGSTIGWTLLALAPIFLASSILTLHTLLRLPSRTTRRALPSIIRFQFLNTFGQAGLQTVFLVDQARLAVDAIVRTLYRLTISHRHFLEWETAAASEARLGNHFSHFAKTMAVAIGITVAALALVAVTSPESLWVAAPLLALWLLAPAMAWLVSRPRIIVETPLTTTQKAELERIAKQIWSFFDKHVGPDDNWLPPDNFQESPLGLVAHRTSPTNIGLYLLSILAAHDFGFIPAATLIDRLRKAFDSLDRLERYRGHFYNWYDTSNASTLQPPYVSTVDSGNLLASLIALHHGLLDLEAKEQNAEIASLADRARAYCSAMSFQFLYNPDRELFSIGFNAATNRLDANHYDLLASEACIASFLAVARGEVPRKHWFRLGRLVTLTAGRTGLISWGGTMFEYLMPRLLLPTSSGILLDSAQKAAVARQIEYGRQTRKPWGISESGFALLDSAQVYQYQSFGVPGLGLKRGLERDHVIAPYATLMAVDIDAAAALANLAVLQKIGGEGQFGFYEAIDFTPGRIRDNGDPSIVQSYMAHHQGMSMLAIANRLMDGIFRTRFLKEPAVRAAQLLLDERVPESAMTIDADDLSVESPVEFEGHLYPMLRRITTPHTPLPRTHLLSNGRYTTMLTNAGGGYSRCDGLDITRWRPDELSDDLGQFLYVRDLRNNSYWSATHQPTCKEAEEYEVIFSIEKAEYRRRDDDIVTALEVVVVPGHNVEIRRISITNNGLRTRSLDVTSFTEIVLATHNADLAHPAFGKLFIESEWIAESQALLFRRRPRSEDQQALFAFHCLATDVPGTSTFESSREIFLGRRRTASRPYALDAKIANLAGTTGSVLDPIAAIRRSFRLKAGERVTFSFTTGFASNREEAASLADRYSHPAAISHGFELAWAHARIEVQGSQWKVEDVHFYQRLAGHLLYPTGPLRASPDILAANRLGQSGLWAFGISGDLPILLLRMHSAAGIIALRQLLQAHLYWQSKVFPVDIVIMLENAGGYQDELHDEVMAQVRQLGMVDRLNHSDGIFVRKGFQINDQDRTLLLAAARVVLDDRSGPLVIQADNIAPPRSLPLRRAMPLPATKSTELPPIKDLQFENAFGGFTSDAREYVLPNGAIPPLPWSNVIANERGGFLITESGSGFVWAGNSQSNRLTPWSNDPISDPTGEVIYIHDEQASTLWCPTPGPVPAAGNVRVRFSQGYAGFEREVEEIHSELTVFVPLEDPVKISQLCLRNNSSRIRRLEIVYHIDWVLGTTWEATIGHIVTRVDSETGSLFAGNRFHPDYGNHIAFADIDLRPRTVTADRMEFLGRNRSLAAPISFSRTAFSGNCGAGLDPCASLRGSITLAPGEARTLIFVIGQASDPKEARRMSRDYCNTASATSTLEHVKAFWSKVCETVQVHTPDPALDLLMNRWLLYQTIACRLWARSAFYQSGGAYGFRDQLQDVCALLHTRPDLARAQLLRAARRQFLEGDVQHWWHEPAGNGVRTRFSDDFLWLPYVTAEYVRATGDAAILQESLPYLTAPLLTPEQQENYGIPSISEQSGTLFDHCQRAINHGWKLGARGLPLMGCGDWNDGMNAVGEKGQGESVWVAWFQVVVLEQFAFLAERVANADAALLSRTHAQQLRDSIEKQAWDGSWYRRAYFDDGTPLGSSTNDECRIDSITQSWAVIAGGERTRAEQAMDAVNQYLTKPEARLLLLFDPPFDKGTLRPGYIRGYVPGVRENGGQYTHAATWVIKALAMLGRGNDAARALALLTPARMPVSSYRCEPYIVAGDVYSARAHVGRGGWSWYTGSSAWLYRVILEDMLGFHREGDRLTLRPCIPANWQRYAIDYQFGKSYYRIEINNPDALESGRCEIRVDGTPVDGEVVYLRDDGNSHVISVDLRTSLPATAQSDSQTSSSRPLSGVIR